MVLTEKKSSEGTFVKQKALIYPSFSILHQSICWKINILSAATKVDYWGHFNYCSCFAIGHMDIAILLWYCRYYIVYCNSFQECLYLLNALHLKKYQRSSSQYRYWGTQWMALPYWWFKNQDAKNARCNRWIVFSFFFIFIVTLRVKSGWKKVFLFSKKLKCLKCRKYQNYG